MTTQELLEKALAALSGDAALSGWAQENYGKALTVVLDTDPDDPPADDSYPLAAFILLEHVRENTSNRQQEWQCLLGVCVRDTEEASLAGLTVPAGRLRVERLRELAEAAVMAAGCGKVECSGSVEREVLHPLYAAASVLTITNK